MRVVVVEDEARIREGIEGLLAMMGEDFVFAGSAKNGREGLALIQKVKPDIIVTDIRMPDMSGLEMLRELEKQEITAKAIVVSAYSEFDYARQAVQLGVMEYILKPISVDEFSKTMNRIKMEIEKEQMIQPDNLGSLGQVIGGVLYGQLQPDTIEETYLRSRFGLDSLSRLLEICIYLGSDYQDAVDKVEKEWDKKLQKDTYLKYCIVRAEYEKALLIVIYQFQDEHELERRIQRWLLNKNERSDFLGSVGWIGAEGLSMLKSTFETIYSYMDWNLTLGEDIVIAYPKITQIQTAVCAYPIELENRLKTELCLGNLEKVRKVVHKFYSYFTGNNVYTPKDVKECFVRFVWALINITKEIDMLDYGKLNQQTILDQIMGAKLFGELRQTVDQLLEEIQLAYGAEEDMNHLTVRRVKSMIHEFYQTGITLDEIALKLNVTPEYLSMQFHREVGETYTSYLKNYRVNKAKELLLGTQMKQYEVAAEVGYTDSKYFGRVFRECTGYTPAEYRKANK